MANGISGVYTGYNRTRLNQQIAQKNNSGNGSIREIIREELDRSKKIGELESLYESGEITSADYERMVKTIDDAIAQKDEKAAKTQPKSSPTIQNKQYTHRVRYYA